MPHSEHRRTCDATCLSLCPWWCRPAAWWGVTFLGVVDGRRGCCGFAIPRLGDELGANAFVKALRVLGGGRGDIMPCSILCASGVEAHAAAEWQFPLVAVAHCCSCRCVPLWWLLLLRLWG
ncbi:hypothetical protein MANES_S037916v8 [Manihot esculenta]|uniref:Uncharacterized protein n=1 Tax=Manihot esculenta TaxID=3983 RepID=A0ACB7FUZ5_MANES|nr:hypothetical protein MANES_S037916v8 [Manihot esculenta]